MKRSWPQTLLFVIALIVANCQCVLACTETPQPSASSAAPPPCHQHSEQDKAAPTHSHSSVVSEERAPSITAKALTQAPANVVAVLAAVPMFSAASSWSSVQYAISPPPSPSLVRSTVLRV
ncbi:MAG: hypothetical protein WDO18_20530 [Acidobacteriota bacterium]